MRIPFPQFFVAFPALWAALNAVASDRPNVVLIFADDMGYGDVTSYDANSQIHTPNLDRLAAEGMRFTDAHSASAVCTPSRYSLLTGRYSWRTELKQGVLGGFSPPLLEPDRMTLGNLFKDAGYATACIGKWHLGMDWAGTADRPNKYDMRNDATGVDFTKPIGRTPIANGFDYYYGISASLDMPPYVFIENDRVTAQPTSDLKSEDSSGGRQGPAVPGWKHKYVTAAFTDKTIEFIGDYQAEPFFIYMPLNSPHTPHAPGDDFIGKSGLDIYGDFMVEVDHHIGRVMDALEHHDVADNTLIIVTSDNGPETNMFPRRDKSGHDSSSHFLGAKRDNWEGGHRVPFIARWPGKVAADSQSGAPFSLVDMMATFADLLGTDLPKDQAGDSVTILPLLEGKDGDYRKIHSFIHHSSSGAFAIRRGDWKLLLHPGSGGNGYGTNNRNSKRYENTIERASWDTGDRQLYNIAKDPDETTNLAEKFPKRVVSMTNIATRIVNRGRSTPGRPLPQITEDWPHVNWLSAD